MNYNYDNAYLRYPCENGMICFEDGSRLKVHDINNPLPGFMRTADLIFTDSPWNQGNLRSFYTKAEKDLDNGWDIFMERLFECIHEINPAICYLEIGKEHLAHYLIAMQKQYRYVTFYNSSYYHKKDNCCYIIRASHANPSPKPRLDGIDEEDVIEWVCQNEKYTCIGDLCMGRGLVAVNAAKAGKRFVGTELNHKRLSVTIERLAKLGLKYEIHAETMF